MKIEDFKIKIALVFTLYFLLATFLIGCATAPITRIQTIVRVEGTKYVPAKSLSEIYNLDYQWDSVAKKVVLTKVDKEARIMADSSTVLLNNEVHAMDKEAKFYGGALLIPESFVRRSLDPFFKEEYIERKPFPAALAPIKSIIIDPGHGGKEPGAVGRGGLKEKDVVLDIAKRLKRKLSAAGINVILTRESDSSVSLSERAKVANSKNADFFISIHANASRSAWVNGIEIFYLSEDIDDDARSVKAAQNYKLNIEERYYGKDTEAILWSLILSDNRVESKQLAEQVCKTLSKNLRQTNRGTKPARFYVLTANIPAILVEVGFISNRSEEKRLGTSSYRDEIAQAVAEGIIQYNRQISQSRTVRY